MAKLDLRKSATRSKLIIFLFFELVKYYCAFSADFCMSPYVLNPMI